MRTPGKIEPVEYFVSGGYDVTNVNGKGRPSGYVLISPYTGCPCPDGYRREFADTLSAVDRLEKTLVQQEHEAAEQEMQLDEQKFGERRQEIRDRLYTRMTSSSTDEFEKEFIRLYLQLRDERKKEKYRQLYLERTAYLWARHNDTPKYRGVDEETFHPDRINVRS